MTIDEVIQELESVAEENQRVVDTGIVFDDVTIDMLYCDDTEVIEEHLANYQKYAEKYRQIADWLKELKQIRQSVQDIKAEIADIYCGAYCDNPYEASQVRDQALEIIDKHISGKEKE